MSHSALRASIQLCRSIKISFMENRRGVQRIWRDGNTDRCVCSGRVCFSLPRRAAARPLNFQRWATPRSAREPHVPPFGGQGVARGPRSPPHLMIVPSQRLLVLAAVVALPLATAAGLVPEMAIPCAVTLALWVMVVAGDAMRGRARLDNLTASAPSIVRFTKDVPARLPITIVNRLKEPLAIRLSVATPPGVTSASFVEDTTIPPGTSRIDWECTGVERGDHAIAAVHMEAPSPFGLWLARAESHRELHRPRLSQPARPRHRRALPAHRRSRTAHAAPGGQRAANSTTCANISPATASKISTGRPPRGASFRW